MFLSCVLELTDTNTNYLQHLNLGILFSRSWSCLLLKRTTWLEFFCIILCFIFIFFFPVFFPSLSFLLPVHIYPASIKPKPMRTRGIWVPAGVKRSDPLWVSHVGLVKSRADFNTCSPMNACMDTSWRGALLCIYWENPCIIRIGGQKYDLEIIMTTMMMSLSSRELILCLLLLSHDYL